MKTRTKLKRAKERTAALERKLEGMQRGERYLFALCERTKREAEAEKEAMLLLLAGCALAAGGEITVHTEKLQRALAGKEIRFGADGAQHTATICVREKAEQGVTL